MPFLRVLRDKRGYETTYLMHWFRDGNRQRSRILYMFRTPPGVRVGRDPIDASVIREIEQQHPDIEFDWRALWEHQQIIETSPDVRKLRLPKSATRPGVVDRRSPRREDSAVREPSAAPPEAPQPRPPIVIPTAIEGTTREDQLVFLLKLYLDLRERVPHRTQDPIRREALLALVERLNPEAWVGEEAVVAGLQSAGEALQRLSVIFSKRRRRPRRARPGTESAGGAPAPSEPPASAE